MNDRRPNPSGTDAGIDDLSDFSFAPEWARERPSVQTPRKPARWKDADDAKHRKRKPSGRDTIRQPYRENRGDRPLGREQTGRFRGESRDMRATAPGGRNASSPRPDSATPRLDPNARSDRQPAPPNLPLDIRFLPEQAAIHAVIRRISATHRAFPLRDIARLFTTKPEACRIRIASRPDTDNADPIDLFRCRICGLPALEAAPIENHLVDQHLDVFFQHEDIEQPEPSGNFTCILRCGYTNELLGPPNFHGTGERIKELLRTRFPSMTEEDFRARMSTLHDAESIEAWKKQNRTRRVYRLRGQDSATKPSSVIVKTDAAAPQDAENQESSQQPETPSHAGTLSRESAEFLMRRDFAPKQLQAVNHLHCPVAIALQTPSHALRHVIQAAWDHEHQRPVNLCFALRGAFRAKRLNTLKANDPHGPEFVMSRVLSPIDPLHSIVDICQILDWIGSHPGGTRQDIEDGIGETFPGGVKHLASQITWLAEKGHIVEFYNGELALAERHPKYRFPSRSEKSAGRRRQSAQNPGPSDAKPAAPEVGTSEPRPTPSSPPTLPADPATTASADTGVPSVVPAKDLGT